MYVIDVVDKLDGWSNIRVDKHDGDHFATVYDSSASPFVDVPEECLDLEVDNISIENNAIVLRCYD